jgi:dienelactone hydrolase
VEDVPEFEEMVRASGSSIEIHTYPGGGHPFADLAGADYDASSAEQMLERVPKFLRRL